MVLAGGRALGRHTTYSYVHTRAATSLNEHLGGRCGVGVVVIKYETKNDFLYSKHFSGVFQHRLRSPGIYSEGHSISRGRSDSYHLNGSAPGIFPLRGPGGMVPAFFFISLLFDFAFLLFELRPGKCTGLQQTQPRRHHQKYTPEI